MLDVGVLFNNAYLLFMHELIHICAFLYESGTQVLRLGGLERTDYVEDDRD